MPFRDYLKNKSKTHRLVFQMQAFIKNLLTADCEDLHKHKGQKQYPVHDGKEG